MPPSSLHLLITENNDKLSNDDLSNEDTHDEDEEADTTAADKDSSAEASKDNAYTNDDPFSMPTTISKKKGTAAGGRKAASNQSGGNRKTIDLDTPQGRSRAPPPRASRPRRGAATPTTPMPTVQRTRSTSCSMRVACPPLMPSPRSTSYLEGRH